MKFFTMRSFIFFIVLSALVLSASGPSLASTSATASASALAASQEDSQKIVLTKVWANGEEAFGIVGVLEINHSDGKIRLEIYDDPCGRFVITAFDQAKCLAMPALRHTIVVPVQGEISACGSRVYSGVERVLQDQGNGIQFELLLEDHTLRLCRDLVPSRIMVDVRMVNRETDEKINYTFMK